MKRFDRWIQEVIRIGKLLGRDISIIDRDEWRRFYFDFERTPAQAWEAECEMYATCPA